MSGETLYICASCFLTSAVKTECHEHGPMVACQPGAPGDAMRQPVKNRHGNYWNTAPRWFLEAVGWIKYGPSAK